MKIYRPIHTNRKVQGWGANLPCVIKGKRPFQFVSCGTPNSEKLYTGALNMKGHSGEDWVAYYKEPVLFPVVAPGIEWEAVTMTDSLGAIIVRVRSTTPVPLKSLPRHIRGKLDMISNQYRDLGGKLYLQFWFVHLQSSAIFGKKKVEPGDILGYADSTGASSGNHLHWSMKVSDINSWFYVDGDNGYQGTIDLDPYFTNTYILDVLANESTSIRALQLRIIILSRKVISLLRQIITTKASQGLKNLL